MDKNECQVRTKSPPWLDLPNPLTELILERLPLLDYIRFGAVCPKWLSIQKEHRVRHSPFPPPMHKSLPWLLPYIFSTIHCLPNGSVGFYSQTDSKLRCLCLPKSVRDTKCVIWSHGWFISIDKNTAAASLLNFVSKSQIQLPPLVIKDSSTHFGGALSAPPVHPDCVALIVDIPNCTVYVSWVGENQLGWISVGFPQGVNNNDYRGPATIYCNGKFYCLLKGITKRFFSVETNLPTPSAQNLNMDCSQLPGDFNNKSYPCCFVESSGDLLLVIEIRRDLNYNAFHELQVFKADFCKMLWVKMKSLGHYALFIADGGSLSVKASDLGCKSNCVYYALDRSYPKSDGTFIAWRMFDMDTMQWSDGPHLPYDAEYFPSHWGCWLLPSL